MLSTTFSFIAVLGVLIFVHEFGHFITAKMFKVKVLKFSLGFGPKLVSMIKGETEYLISSFPLGGYVKMLGEQPGEDVDEEEKRRSFSWKPVWQRFIIVACGPLFNLLFAFLVFFLINATIGMPVPDTTQGPDTEIGVVNPKSPAEMAGVKVGDIIIAINGQATDTWEQVSTLVGGSNGQELALSLKRGEEVVEVLGTPSTQEDKTMFGEVVGKRYLLGIMKKTHYVYEQTSLPDSISSAVQQTWFYINLTIMGIVKIFQKVIPASEIGGPILIASMAGQQMEAGLVQFFSFMAILSINLGIINLFPIPILDGGHLVFFSIEALRRRSLSLQAQEKMQQVGLVLLGSLMVFVFYNDLARIFQG